MMKKTLYLWVFLVLTLITLTSCSSPVTGVTTVRLSGWQSNPNEKQLLQQVLQQFESQHPNIKVKYETINDQYMDVIKTRLMGDAAPDIFYLDSLEAPMLMKYGVLEPLNSYIPKDFDISDFQPSLLKAFQLGGKIYGLPKDFSTLALFYNKKAFQEAGIRAPKTWEYGFGLSPDLSRQYFMMTAYGGSLVDQKGNAAFANPNYLKGLQLIIDQYRQDKTSAQPSDVGVSSGSEMFGQGKAAMVLEGSWAIPYLKDTFSELEFATAEVPKVNGKKRTMAYTVAYVMNKKTKHKDAAWQVMSYLTGKEGMKAWAKEGLVLPARKSVLEELGYAENPLYAPFVAGAAYATIWQAGENLPTVLLHFNNQFISALIGQQPLQNAMLKAQQSANKEIEAAS
jgi:multiple sugar transport system substrate-binding protein